MTSVATNPGKQAEPAPAPTSSEATAHHEDKAGDPAQPLRDAEVFVDVVEAMARTPAGSVRFKLVGWLGEQAHARADALRERAANEAPERGKVLVRLADAMDGFGSPKKAEQIREDEVAAMRRDLERASPQVAACIAPTGSYQCNGRLAPEAIQLIVRLNFARFRDCYEAGLRRNANLSGRVSTKFVIERDGRISSVADEHSTLPDPEVIRCIDAGFVDLHFGPPHGGITTVVYPIMFNPG
jgi:hypothetical protein